MYILLKLHYAKFDVSKLFCSKVIKEKPLGVEPTPLVKEGLQVFIPSIDLSQEILAIDVLTALKFFFEKSSQIYIFSSNSG